ncbi:cytochrome P450 [Streptomyces sp. DSM 44915]|uniref:Cytochrome P450 n=1 Tax=Streptomyces chisholmiae TaxID=3075540 RepID=A0ABU2JNL1_9ACTN|nr:cytochrome P450 [Streptomyces sp. DSM 44915]MDT0266580.1 cytochrome P450 [Streptomyces sp. DSM 44915]
MSLTTRQPTVHDALAADVPTASAQLLAGACPRHDPALDAWFVADHPTARRLLADRRLRSRDSAHSTADLTDEQRRLVAPLEDHVGRWLVFSDEPRLADLRVRTRRALRPEADPGRAAWLTELARHHRPADLTDTDLLTGHIVPFTTAATLRVLGCDPERDGQLVAWGEDLIAYLGLDVYREDVVRRALTALAALRSHVRRWLPTAGGPVGDALRAAAGEGAGAADLTAVFTQLLTGGLDPTRAALAVGVDRLCAPGGRAAFLAAPAGFVDEVLRLASPFHFAPRTTGEPLPVGADTIPAGSRVSVVLCAANRDPALFPDPERLDTGRPRRRHLAFGHGRHFCAGAGLAEEMVTAGLTAIAESLDEHRHRAALRVRRTPGMTRGVGLRITRAPA